MSDPAEGLKDHHCRYIYGDPSSGEWRYCRLPRARDPETGAHRRQMWCEAHYAECCIPAPRLGTRPRRRRAVQVTGRDPVGDAALLDPGLDEAA
jgi:hypothetical protein